MADQTNTLKDFFGQELAVGDIVACAVWGKREGAKASVGRVKAIEMKSRSAWDDRKELVILIERYVRKPGRYVRNPDVKWVPGDYILRSQEFSVHHWSQDRPIFKAPDGYVFEEPRSSE